MLWLLGMSKVNCNHRKTELAAWPISSMVCCSLLFCSSWWPQSLMTNLSSCHCTLVPIIFKMTLMSSTYLMKAHNLTPASFNLVRKTFAHISITICATRKVQAYGAPHQLSVPVTPKLVNMVRKYNLDSQTHSDS